MSRIRFREEIWNFTGFKLFQRALFFIVGFMIVGGMLRTISIVTNPNTFEQRLELQLFPETIVYNTATITNETAVICTIIKDAERYVDEWVDYHYAIGFAKFFLYVNEDYFYLQRWAELKGSHVSLIHFPGEAKQQRSSEHCARMLQTTTNHTWAGFFDIDEFLVIKDPKYNNVVEFLREHCVTGSVAVNWYLMGPSFYGDEYSRIPLSKRCQYRAKEAQRLVKNIARVRDLNLSYVNSSHYMPLKHGIQHDTSGKKVGPKSTNRRSPSDVALFYHFHSKSRKEYIEKRLRGRPTFPANHSSNHDLQMKAMKGIYYNESFDVFDDTIWQILKKHAPEYAYFDLIQEPNITERKVQW